MRIGRERFDWGLMSSLLAMTAEVNRDRKKRPQPFTPDDFNPTTTDDNEKIVPGSIRLLAALIPGAKYQPN